MYEILKKKNNFPTDRPISEKQGRERGNKNIFKVGPISFKSVVLLSNSLNHFYNFHPINFICGGETTQNRIWNSIFIQLI